MAHRIPNDIFRKRFRELEKVDFITFADVAYRIGWVTKSKNGVEKPDSSRVARTLGLVEETVRGERKYRESMTVANALKLCEALHIDPWEVGL